MTKLKKLDFFKRIIS